MLCRMRHPSAGSGDTPAARTSSSKEFRMLHVQTQIRRWRKKDHEGSSSRVEISERRGLAARLGFRDSCKLRWVLEQPSNGVLFATRRTIGHELRNVQQLHNTASQRFAACIQGDGAGGGAIERHSAPQQVPHARHAVCKHSSVRAAIKPARQIRKIRAHTVSRIEPTYMWRWWS